MKQSQTTLSLFLVIKKQEIKKNGAEKDSERNGKIITAVAAVASRVFILFFSFSSPPRALSKPFSYMRQSLCK
jgi:hypothetical protein